MKIQIVQATAWIQLRNAVKNRKFSIADNERELARTNHPPLTEKSSEERNVRFFPYPLEGSTVFLSREFARNFVGRGVLSFPFTGLTRELKVLPWLQGRCHGLESAKRRERERGHGCVSLRTVPLLPVFGFSFSHACIDPTGCRM